MLELFKKVVFWTYPRGSWQYDILCALILCFIFLTPKSVFDGSAFLRKGSDAVPDQEIQANEEATVQPPEILPDERPEKPAIASSQIP